MNRKISCFLCVCVSPESFKHELNFKKINSHYSHCLGSWARNFSLIGAYFSAHSHVFPWGIKGSASPTKKEKVFWLHLADSWRKSLEIHWQTRRQEVRWSLDFSCMACSQNLFFFYQFKHRRSPTGTLTVWWLLHLSTPQKDVLNVVSWKTEFSISLPRRESI